MAFWDNWFKKDNISKLPLQSKRSSESEDDTVSFSSLLSELGASLPDFEVELLKVIEKLAIYNPDVSYAVENVVTLGNTPYMIEFEDSAPETLKKKALDLIRKDSSKWYDYSSGTNSLINDLLTQVCINGAISAECIPNNALKGVESVVLVAPKKIRFIWDKQISKYKPYQQTKNKTTQTLIELNPIQYRYIALRKHSDKPYGIPPFLSALEHISIEKSMIEDLKHVTSKLGILGFLKIMVNTPAKKPGESDDAYYNRCKSYLSAQIPEAEKAVKKGFMLGFKGNHEIEMANINSNVQGAKELFQLNTEIKIAGLKQDPSMLGRNFSTTETQSRVVLAKLGTQITNYQDTVASFLEYLFKLHLRLNGINIEFLKVTFEKPLITDKSKDAEAYSKEIDNAQKLYKAGIISQEQFAQLVGYEKADSEGPRQEVTVDPNTPVPSNEDDPEDSLKKNFNWRQYISEIEEFDYCLDSKCSCSTRVPLHKELEQLAKGESLYEKLLMGYLQKTLSTYSQAVEDSVRAIGTGLNDLGDNPSLEQLQDLIFYHLYKDWNKRFTDKQVKVSNKEISTIYSRLRSDKSIFESLDQINQKQVPDSIFSVIDNRAIEYFKNLDELYLGKFIQDTDTRKAITDFIKKEYIGNNLPLGSNRDPETLKAFREKFGDVLKGEDWKINRIIQTTVAKIRNYSAVSYMNQALIEEFEIVGILDRLQCEYCRGLQGVTFNVKTALGKIEKVVSSEPDFVKSDAPFINSVFKNPEEIKGKSGSELQAQGIDVPPYHPNCRDRIVAVFSEVVTEDSNKDKIIAKALERIDNLPKGKIFEDAKLIDGIFNKSTKSWHEVIESYESILDEPKETFINLRDIRITQPNIQANKAKAMVENIENVTEIINVVLFKNKEYAIYDGHHRLTAHWAMGDKKIKVNLKILK